MNGNELRAALRGEMAAGHTPPPLSTAAMLGVARQARARRRTVWACAGSAAAVLALAGVATANTPGGVYSGPADNAPVGPSTKPADSASAAAPTSKDSATPWPTGPDGRPQEDRTAQAGSRYDQGVRLLSEIVSVVPAGYTAPEDATGRPADAMPRRSHQAQFEERVDGVDVWSYMSSAALAQGERTGRLLVETHTAGNQLPSEPCALARGFWGMQGECQVVTVGAAQVGVVARPTVDDRFDQWAAYRHPDGVVVFVAQGRRLDANEPALITLPFSLRELAGLAVDERFHLE
ncbi:hypothetical protein E1211_04730 [Micromonospora sp. 15K316]|uniref:hypothetical protein n=1 Tax=Micromonospora sp. 15K316 TaxID=2530376 RepID=UPI0010521B07|nr:hypothetical protein [Micromonospora sp. 15K316]TDC39294.1 hypothetical protein E1211_04730 [Micromonospora sp. 15K316]